MAEVCRVIVAGATILVKLSQNSLRADTLENTASDFDLKLTITAHIRPCVRIKLGENEHFDPVKASQDAAMGVVQSTRLP